MVGSSITASGDEHAFLWEKGMMTDIGPRGVRSVALGINPAGQVVGFRLTRAGNRAVIWTRK